MKRLREIRHAARGLLTGVRNEFLRFTRLDGFIVRRFHRLYYMRREELESHANQDTLWLGTTTQKCPLDLWVYQEILGEVRPSLIVETGTNWGGSALYLASICDLLDAGRVVTIDIEEKARPEHPRVTYLTGSSTAPEIVERVHSEARGERALVILDSDHRRPHVEAELDIYADLVAPGSYLIVEDSNLNGHPVWRGHGPGPMEALESFLSRDHRFVRDAAREKFLLTFNPCGYLRRVF